MNKIVHVLTTTLLLTAANVMIVGTRSPVDNSRVNAQPSPGIIAPKGRDLIAKFECRSRGPSTGEIWLRANGNYQVKHNSGKYISTPIGYRFVNGSLRGQSIVKQQENVYLVNTRDEARAAELAQVDGALFCTGGNIYY